jgi:putative DNA primase/helicase
MNYQNKLNAAIQFGLLVDAIEEDEQIHRTATVAKPRNKNGWYVSYGDLLVMGDWVTGHTEVWKPNGYQRSFIDAKRIKEAIARNKEQRCEEQKRAAIRARTQYQQAQQVAIHPYLSAKGIETADGLKLAGSWLIVPLYDVETNELVNLQRIAPDGTKLFLKGGQITGAGCPICLTDEPTSRMFICEGYATAASVHHITHQPVIAAMNAGNLLPVAKAVMKRWPDVEIVIAGDDDWLTEQETGTNPGKLKAIEAANAIGAKVSFPPFTTEHKKAGLTDWNDYYSVTSNKAVAK